MKKTIILGLLMFTFSFYACKNEKIDKTNESKKGVNGVLTKFDGNGNYYLSYEEVDGQLIGNGAVEVSAPPLFENPFEGTTSVHHFERAGKTYTVFVFPYGDIDEDAGVPCAFYWDSSGAGSCEGPGNSCGYVINGDTTGFKIICCD